MDNRRLVYFHLGMTQDDRGRTRADIDRFSIKLLEETHDYIQYLFPLPESSAYNPEAPIMDQEVLNEFRTNENLKDSLRRACSLMAWFYGTYNGWMTRNNHNYLRITRIIRCLVLVGLQKEAEEFHKLVKDLVSQRERVVSDLTLCFWEEALKGSTYSC